MLVHSIPYHSQKDAMKQRVTFALDNAIVDSNLKARYDFAADAAKTTVDLINKFDDI